MFSFLNLSDPRWTGIGVFVGVFATFIGVGITQYLNYSQRTRKSLSWEKVAERALLAVHNDVREKLKITYEDVPVQNIYLIIIKFLNDGNVPILETDFEKGHGLTVSLGTNARVISAEITDPSPADLTPTLRIAQSSVTVQPLLLNSRDKFQINILCYDYHYGDVLVIGRIAGVREIKFFKSSTQNDDFFDKRLNTIISVISFMVMGLLLASIMGLNISSVLYSIAVSSFIVTLVRFMINKYVSRG
jgi:hypothetical protein